MNLVKYNRAVPSALASAARKVAARASAVVAGSLASFAAFAASDPGAAITAEITSAKTTITGILVVLAGIVGLFILWAYLKRAR